MLVGWKRAGLLGAALVLLFSLSACFWRSSEAPPASPSLAQQSVLKPRPRVTAITASTAGFLEDYYAILDANIKNEGAEGTILVVATLSQGAITTTKQVPMFLRKGSTQVVRFIFPLKWKGGEWTPSVTAEVP